MIEKRFVMLGRWNNYAVPYAVNFNVKICSARGPVPVLLLTSR